MLHYYVPLAFMAIGLWASFRVVQMPAFADFLISVEGEMNKVSWPSRGELFRAIAGRNPGHFLPGGIVVCVRLRC